MSTASGDEYLVADSTALQASRQVAAPAVEKSPPAQWPYLVICLFASVGLILIALGSVSEGLTGLALAMGVASVVRLVLPSTTAGWLTSRSRVVDVGLFAALGLALGAVTYLLFS
jgi:hypothetical protein